MSDEPRELSGKALGYWAGRLGIDRAPGETDDQLRARAAVCRALSLLGWDLAFADIDAARGHARMQLRRGDVLVTFHADRTGDRVRASTTRERIERTEVIVGRRGDRARVERLTTRFVGRERHEGVRAGMRWLAAYLADNSNGALLPAGARAVLAPLLSPPVAAEAETDAAWAAERAAIVRAKGEG